MSEECPINLDSEMESGDSGVSPSTTQRLLTLRPFPSEKQKVSTLTSFGKKKQALTEPPISKDISSSSKRKDSPVVRSSPQGPTGKEEEAPPNKRQITAEKQEMEDEPLGEWTQTFDEWDASQEQLTQAKMDVEVDLIDFQEDLEDETGWYCGNCNCDSCHALACYEERLEPAYDSEPEV